MVTETIRITHEVDEFISKRGTPFKIEPTQGGLWKVKMLGGGKTPPLCEEQFTSYNRARVQLEKYLTQHDPLDYAIYPSKVKRAQSKTKQII
jgi:hypothetical protein